MAEKKKNAPAAAKTAGGAAAKRKTVQPDAGAKNAATGQETAFTAVVTLGGKYAYLNLRESPSIDASVLATLPDGEKVTFVGLDKGSVVGSAVWMNVRRADGTTGWAMGRYLTIK